MGYHIKLNLRTAYAIINGLRKIQAEDYTYDEFLSVIKRRLRIYTGRDEVNFYNEEQVANLLCELGVVTNNTGKG
jgi:hypothetical protein